MVGADRIDRFELQRALRAAGAVVPDAELVALRHRPIGLGLTADTLRVEITWRERDAGPSTLVAKIASTDPKAARTAASLGVHEREVRFYRDLAPRTSISRPQFLGVLEVDGQPPGLLLEDLSGLSTGDQFAGAHPAMLQRMREQLVALQAPFWNDPELAAAPWLHRRLGVPIPAIQDRMRASWRATRDRLASGFAEEERAQIDRFVAAAGSWAESLTGPFSLTHHDFRVDNMLFGADHVVVLDWQTVGWGAPMFDVAYLLGTSLEPETRRRIEREEVARHVAALADHGIAWSFAEAWTAYRQASFAVLLMLVPPTGSVKRTERGDAMFRRLLQRGARMALDLGADEFLPAATKTSTEPHCD